MPPDAEHQLSRSERRTLDDTFKVSVILKGLDGLLELIGGTLLLIVAPATINRLVRLTQHELSQDRHDFIATRLLHASHNLNHTQVFGALYLLAHGAVKIVLVYGLLKNQRWAYPASLAFLGFFIIYQLYRIAVVPSIGLILLTIFDTFIVWLVWREYRLRYPSAGPPLHPGIL
ncbi:MAG: DUF2127 domain-containing protein [Actinomycetota bacterium]|nr:DUF2127 domain-containing protein [Actinomycetota bacterium]